MAPDEIRREDPDRALVDQAQGAPEGDMRAFERLVSRHQDGVVANCRFLTRSEDDAEDLAQEVFLKAFFGLSRFEGRSTFKSWLQRIKANHCLNFIRSRKKDFVDVEDESVSGAPELRVEPRAEQVAEQAANRRAIEEVLDSLPDTLRVALVLRDLDELSYQEIAETLGIGLSAAKMRIKRARQEFRARFETLKGIP